MGIQISVLSTATQARATVLAFATHSLRKPANAEIWHQRLGHASYNIVEQMVRKGIVVGLDITTLVHQPGFCEDCVMGKQTRHPFDGNTHPATKVLEHVHIDLWGPSCVISIGGKQYMMEAVNAYGGTQKDTSSLTRKQRPHSQH